MTKEIKYSGCRIERGKKLNALLGGVGALPKGFLNLTRLKGSGATSSDSALPRRSPQLAERVLVGVIVVDELSFAKFHC